MMAPRPRSKEPRAPTLEDVARLAGVSPKTVSRVVNGEPNVRAATRNKVQAAIDEVGFRPNLAARSLAAARSFLIGTIMPNVTVNYYHEIYRGAARACRRLAYHLIIEEFDRGEETPTEFYTAHLSKTAYDGFLLPPPICDDVDLLNALDRDGIRYARIAPAVDIDRSPSVFADDPAGVEALVDHLWSAGHRTFGIVIGSPEHAAAPVRWKSYRSAIEKHGGDGEAIVVIESVWDGTVVETGQIAAKALFDRPDRPTAVFCFNDEIAAGIASFAQRRGIRVPDDLAVAGFDDSEIAQLIWPPLTTIRQPIAEMADLAITTLVAPATEPPARICCPVELVIRESTGGRSGTNG